MHFLQRCRATPLDLLRSWPWVLSLLLYVAPIADHARPAVLCLRHLAKIGVDVLFLFSCSTHSTCAFHSTSPLHLCVIFLFFLLFSQKQWTGRRKHYAGVLNGATSLRSTECSLFLVAKAYIHTWIGSYLCMQSPLGLLCQLSNHIVCKVSPKIVRDAEMRRQPQPPGDICVPPKVW